MVEMNFVSGCQRLSSCRHVLLVAVLGLLAGSTMAQEPARHIRRDQGFSLPVFLQHRKPPSQNPAQSDSVQTNGKQEQARSAMTAKKIGANTWGVDDAQTARSLSTKSTAVSSSRTSQFVRNDEGAVRRPSQIISPAYVDSFPQDPVDQPSDDDAKAASQSSGQEPRSLMRPIQQIDLNLQMANANQPADRSYQLFSTSNSNWSSQAISSPLFYQWEAPNIRYRKLYFEDVAVERYGQTDCGWRQVYRATAHWGASLLTAPIKMRFDPYYDCDTPYGYCRPGECVNPIWQRQLLNQ